jgi:hypothetical protein
MTHNWPTQPIYLVHLYMVKVDGFEKTKEGKNMGLGKT